MLRNIMIFFSWIVCDNIVALIINQNMKNQGYQSTHQPQYNDICYYRRHGKWKQLNDVNMSSESEARQCL